MDGSGVMACVSRLSLIDVATLSNVAALEALADARRVQSWAEGRTAALRRRVRETSPSPAAARDDANDATASSQAAGRRDDRRADATGRIPEAQAALDEGELHGEHVDAIAVALASLEPDEQALLANMGPQLVEAATTMRPDQYRAWLRGLVDRLRRDAGQARLERQKRATRLTTWTDRESGMWRLNGWFDPELAALVSQHLDAALRRRFAQETPDFCPTDPTQRVDWLRAHALADLCRRGGDGGRASGAQAEVTIVVTAPEGRVDTGRGEPVSPDFVADLIRQGAARAFTVVAGDGLVVEAPGPLNLGRSTRIANRAQRRALHALYDTCAMPGCATDYRRCRLHHVVWWRHGGRTDLDNLLPVCDGHHQALHDEDWEVRLGPRRELTVIRPDGTVFMTGPPGRGP